MKKLGILTLVAALSLSGCANMSETDRGTAQGAGIGAVAGAALGALTGGGRDGAATGAVLGGMAGAVIGNVWSSRMEKQRQDMQQATQGTGVQVSRTADNRLKLDIPSDISFDTNRADIKSNFRPILDKFASGLIENPSTNVTIIGHTDNRGSDAINDPLSVNRAARTRDYLTNRGVSSTRIAINGRGSHEPIASNATDAGRARNRRVEIFVAEPQQGQQPQQPQPRY